MWFLVGVVCGWLLAIGVGCLFAMGRDDDYR